MATRTLEIKFLGDASGAQRAMAEVDDAGGKLEGRLGGLKGAFGGVATVAGGFLAGQALQAGAGFLLDAANAAAEDAAATDRLEQALRNTSGAFDENLAKVNERIDAGQKLAFGDDAVRDSFQSLLAATGDTDEALRRQSVAMDLARGAGISLEQASRMVGKVNEENVDQFRRMGIVIKDGATEAEALAAVQAKFAGQADVYAKSTSGQMEQAKLRMGELKEQLGAALLPAFTAFVTVLVTEVLPAVERFANAAGPKIQEFAQNVKKYWETDIKPALDNLKKAWEDLQPVIEPILTMIADDIKNIATVLKDTVDLILAIISGDWGRAWSEAKNLVTDFWQLFKDKVEGLATILTGAVTIVVEAAKTLGSSIVSAIWDGLGDLWALGADIVHWVLQGIKDMAWSIIDYVTGLAGDIKDKLDPTNIISGVGGAVGGMFGGGGGGGAGGGAIVATAPESQAMAWDNQAQAWVYPWAVGSMGSPSARLTGAAAGWVGGGGGVTVNITGPVSVRSQSEANQLLTTAARAAGLA